MLLVSLRLSKKPSVSYKVFSLTVHVLFVPCDALTGVPSRFLNLAEPVEENWTANLRLGGEKSFFSTKALAGTSAERTVVLKRSETKSEPIVLKPILTMSRDPWPKSQLRVRDHSPTRACRVPVEYTYMPSGVIVSGRSARMMK